MSEESRKFVQYFSIENAYSEKFRTKIREHPCSQKIWVATEKIHGINFSFTTDGKQVRVAKRTSFLSPDELDSFYKCQDILEKYRVHILHLFTLFSASEVTVFGELFGGSYPGIPSQSKLIQKGIFYCPEHKFYAFDIRVDGNYLNYDDAVKAFETVGLFYAKPLFRGTLDEVLAWSEQHKSDITTIPGYFNLPPIKDNRREGNVLRPVEFAQLFKGSTLILKDKNPAFSERAPKKVVKEAPPISSELEEALNDALRYVTPQRYDNVVSKIGEVSSKDIGKLIGLISKDALEDFAKNSSIALKKEEEKVVHRAVNAEARKIILAQF